METCSLQLALLFSFVVICGCKSSGDTGPPKSPAALQSSDSTGPKRVTEEELPKPPENANRQSNATVTLTFWIVSEKPVEGGSYIDTPLFPKLGFIRKQPDLMINRLKTVFEGREPGIDAKGEEIENIYLNVHLLDADGPGLEKLTSDNQGKRVLIMVGHRPVAAPKILGVLGSTFQLHCKDDETLKEAREKLADLVLK